MAAPVYRYESAVAVLGGLIYYFGGFRNADIQASAELWAYDPERQSWSRKGDLPALPSRKSHYTGTMYHILAAVSSRLTAHPHHAILSRCRGGVAQLGERDNRTVEVRSSSLLTSTTTSFCERVGL